MAVELVNVRLQLQVESDSVTLPELAAGNTALPRHHCAIKGIGHDVAVYWRADLTRGQDIFGPALITETVSTTLIEPGWRAQVDPVGNLLLERD